MGILPFDCLISLVKLNDTADGKRDDKQLHFLLFVPVADVANKVQRFNRQRWCSRAVNKRSPRHTGAA